MRLATWNCCAGPLERKLAAAASLSADLLVIPECPALPRTGPRHVWAGTNPRKGLAVIAGDGYRLRRVPRRTPLPEFVVPLMVEGPTPFLLLAVWMKGAGPHRYVRGLHRAIEGCRRLIAKHPTVVLGDFNSNAIWDEEHPEGLSHSALVSRLDALGLESAYHRARGEAHGAEREATFYFYRRRTIPYHLDYCFLPRTWGPRLRQVTVGGWKEWRSLSDHVPLVAELAPLPPSRPPS